MGRLTLTLSSQSPFSDIVNFAIWSVGGPSLRAAVGQDAFISTTFFVGALVTVGFFTGPDGAGRAVDVLGTGCGACWGVIFEAAGCAVDVLRACTGVCSALKLLGPGTVDMRAVDLGFDFWLTAACAGGAGGGVFGRVTCGIGGGTTFEGPATGRCGGVAEAVPLLSFWFSRKTARALRCSSTKSKLSTIPLLAAKIGRAHV